jgi:hypothetical protein
MENRNRIPATDGEIERYPERLSNLPIDALIKLDMGDAIRKLTNENNLIVANILYSKSSLTFGELRDESDLPTNKLNHTLAEMKKSHLVIQINKQYYLTRYCNILLDSLKKLKVDISALSLNGELFSPVKQE